MEEDEGLVQSGGGPHPTTRTSHNQAAHRAYPGVAAVTLGRNGGKGVRDYDIRPIGLGDKGRQRSRGWGGRAGENHVGVDGGVDTDGFSGRRHSRRCDLAGGSPNTERGQGLPYNRSRGGGVEGSGGDTQLLLHRLHHLPRLPPWVLGGMQYGDRNPQGQTD